MTESKPIIDFFEDDPKSVAGYNAAIESGFARPVPIKESSKQQGVQEQEVGQIMDQGQQYDPQTGQD